VVVTVAPGVENVLGEREVVTLLIRSAPSDRLKAAVAAAADDIAATGLLLTTGEPVIGAEVFRSDGTRWRPTEQEWVDKQELWDFACPSYVHGPVPVPGGLLLSIDYHYTPPELSQQTPGLLIGRLNAAGIPDAQITLAPQLSDDRFTALRSFSPVVRASIRADAEPYSPPHFGDLPSAAILTDLATAWLRGQQSPGMQLLAVATGSTEVPLTWESFGPVVGQVLTVDLSTHVVVSDFAGRAATACLGSFGKTGISLAAAARGWSTEQVATQMRALREVVRPVAGEVAWAGVTTYASTETAEDVLVDDLLQDEIHLGLMWYQVLSPAQLQRMGGPPPQAVELAAGRFELAIGEPEQWIPGHPGHDAIRAHARSILGP
jgi:hypothetical protein